MATTKQARGTKRTCQSDECGARFYDLNRDPIVCPICGTIYVIASGPVGVLFKDEEKAQRKVKKETAKADEAADEVEEEIEDIEDADAVEEDADDTFLEDEEEDGGDVTTIVGGRGGDDEEV
ncbi:MAG: TIGR02300 family protein [Hyphomicrobiaceae bacterium]